MKLIKSILLTTAIIFTGCSLNQPNSANTNANLDQQCKTGNLESCHDLGRMYQGGKGVSKDFTKAYGIYIQNCKNGYMKSCVSAGTMQRIGLGVERNGKNALKLYSYACKGGEANACKQIAEEFVVGDVLNKNEKKAKMFLKRALSIYEKECNDGKGDIYSCLETGETYAYNGVEKDFDKALYYLDLGCKQNEETSCFFYKNVQKQMAQTKKVEDLCKAGDIPSCSDIASQYDSGSTVTKDKKKAKFYYTKACKAGSKISCLSLALNEGGKSGLKKIQKLCDGDYAMACRNLAYKYLDNKDKQNAFNSFSKACDLGDSLSCNQVGR